MNDSSIPDVIDWLVTNIAALPECAAPVLISDGSPDTEEPTMVIVGGALAPLVTDQNTVETIGSPQSEMEEYVVDVEIHASTGEADQKTVRDQVFVIYNALRRLIGADRSLGGLLEFGAYVANWSLQQTTAAEADEGRSAVLTVGIRVRFWLGA